jgi:hypothetical protein
MKKEKSKFRKFLLNFLVCAVFIVGVVFALRAYFDSEGIILFGNNKVDYGNGYDVSGEEVRGSFNTLIDSGAHMGRLWVFGEDLKKDMTVVVNLEINSVSANREVSAAVTDTPRDGYISIVYPITVSSGDVVRFLVNIMDENTKVRDFVVQIEVKIEELESLLKLNKDFVAQPAGVEVSGELSGEIYLESFHVALSQGSAYIVEVYEEIEGTDFPYRVSEAALLRDIKNEYFHLAMDTDSMDKGKYFVRVIFEGESIIREYRFTVGENTSGISGEPEEIVIENSYAGIVLNKDDLDNFSLMPVKEIANGYTGNIYVWFESPRSNETNNILYEMKFNDRTVNSYEKSVNVGANEKVVEELRYTLGAWPSGSYSISISERKNGDVIERIIVEWTVGA